MNEETLSISQELTGQEPTDMELSSQTLTEQKLEEYLAKDEYDYQLPQRGDIQPGIVIEISGHGAVIDAGFKRDGIVLPQDLDRLDEETRSSIQPGDEISVAVEKPQDKEGRLILSIYQALVQEDWLKAEEMMDEGELYEGKISGYNRGGLLVPFGRIRGFVPASHVVGMPRGLKGEERRQRLADMVDEEVGLKIIEVDRQRRRLILSQRQARRAWQKVQRERVMEELTEGEVCHGTVTGITDFGAFVDLGGADGLIHISELSWKQVDDPREVVDIGDEVDVYILNLDWKRKRIALSLKRLQPNPWTQVSEHYSVDQLVEGKVNRVLDFGAFVELDLGVEGLLHISEMTGTSQLSPSDIVQTGEKVLVKIISIDTHKERIALSARQVHRDEWERWMVENKPLSERREVAEEATGPEEALALEAEAEEPAEEKAAAPEAEGDEVEEATTLAEEGLEAEEDVEEAEEAAALAEEGLEAEEDVEEAEEAAALAEEGLEAEEDVEEAEEAAALVEEETEAPEEVSASGAEEEAEEMPSPETEEEAT